MVEGIERKEPDSPRALPNGDGEHIEEECKFLPPPKTIAHPRLFMIKNDGQVGYEYLNYEQLEYQFRCRHKDTELVQSTRNEITLDGEKAISHFFLKKYNGAKPGKTQLPTYTQGLTDIDIPRIPQSVELVNQTVSVPREPVKEEFVWRCIHEFRNLTASPQLVADFENAINRYNQMRAKQADEKNRLRVQEIKSKDHIEGENKLLLRIAREKGIDINKLIGDEYKPLKTIVKEE